MAITISPIKFSGSKKITELVAFHSTEQPAVFYQEYKVPFSVLLMTVQSGHPERSSMSFLTPESEFFIPAVNLSGRSTTSQHQHNIFEFTYVLDGSMYQRVEGKQYFYPTGSCCLMNRNTLHTEETGTDFTCVFMTLSAEFVGNMLAFGKSMLFPGEKERLGNMIFTFLERNLDNSDIDTKDFLDFMPKIGRQDQIQIVHSIFEELLALLIIPEEGATYKLMELVSRFIGIMCDENYYSGVHVTAKSNMDSLLFARINQILYQCHGRISNSELSDLLNYNGSYLGRIVKKYTGKSLFDYSMTFAMEYAAEQLLHTERTTASIASELRFSNRSHFYKLFYEYYGTTPGEYRIKQSQN